MAAGGEACRAVGSGLPQHARRLHESALGSVSGGGAPGVEGWPWGLEVPGSDGLCPPFSQFSYH